MVAQCCSPAHTCAHMLSPMHFWGQMASFPHALCRVRGQDGQGGFPERHDCSNGGGCTLMVCNSSEEGAVLVFLISDSPHSHSKLTFPYPGLVRGYHHSLPSHLEGLNTAWLRQRLITSLSQVTTMSRVGTHPPTVPCQSLHCLLLPAPIALS